MNGRLCRVMIPCPTDTENTDAMSRKKAPLYGASLVCRDFHRRLFAVSHCWAWCAAERWMPANLVRFNMSALTATSAELPDMASAAISGLNVNG